MPDNSRRRADAITLKSSPRLSLLKLIEMFQPRQHNLLTCLLDLSSQKHLVEYRVDLVEVEDQIQLAHIAEEGVQHLDEKVDGLQVRQLVVVGVDACAEEEPRVPAVHDLVVSELDEVGLVLLVARCYETVDLRPVSANIVGFRGSEREREREIGGRFV